MNDRANPDPDPSMLGERYLGWLILTFLGISHLITAGSAIFRDHLFLMSDLHDDYLLGFSVPTWGWIHLVTGLLLLILATFGLFTDARWVRPVAVIALVLSALTALAWLPYLPFWAFPLMLVDVVAIWVFLRPGRAADGARR